jgi:uncharacterized protein (DUF1810 family)
MRYGLDDVTSFPVSKTSGEAGAATTATTMTPDAAVATTAASAISTTTTTTTIDGQLSTDKREKEDKDTSATNNKHSHGGAFQDVLKAIKEKKASVPTTDESSSNYPHTLLPPAVSKFSAEKKDNSEYGNEHSASDHNERKHHTVLKPQPARRKIHSFDDDDDDDEDSSSQGEGTQKDIDPFRITSRFVSPHLIYFEQAIKEIQQGQKQGCWIWYLFPTPPFLVDGIERGSRQNRYYALRTPDEATAYLQHTHPQVNLRQNFLNLLTAVHDQLQNNGIYLCDLFPYGDHKKVLSSIRLFQETSQRLGDEELCTLCERILTLVEAMNSDTAATVARPRKRTFLQSRYNRQMSH